MLEINRNKKMKKLKKNRKSPVEAGGSVPTGDSNNLVMWFALTMFAGICLFVAIVFGKKTSRRREE